MRRSLAEFIGTFWLVLGGCGSAVLAAAFPYATDPERLVNLYGLGFLGVSLAFGLSVLTMAYAIAHVSGCHLNPAVSLGLWAAGRFPAGAVVPYVAAQVAGATAAGSFIYTVARGRPQFALTGSNPLATNGYGAHSPGGYSMLACVLTELVLTFMFVVVILGATDPRAPQAMAGLTIGLTLTLIHLISIPVTNTSVNPARSTGVALIAGLEHIRQLWMFWLVPLLAAVLAGPFYRTVFGVTDVLVSSDDLGKRSRAA
jgi:aquaporin Z